MRDVYVAGIGITTFTRLEYALSEIASYASMMALKDAGVTEVDDVYVANMGGARVNHQTALASAVVDSLSLTPAGAAAISRAARFTVSPITVNVLLNSLPISPAKTCPRLTPIFN